eukprot:Plantae.Rhodophyta-Rhodochaete_pulchella.ctg24677.p1 GENE.Plantae.Rhodophyta-Rhodochaete_pulchella.ctg24677~~Plantae.Rhodophyta-Rhodochaete_pulchella.ctg24677.p1  ORF type:complete len:337 (-),score=61.43 Plantae.Rhodophyta-Rhodochaete_pulchella.ctg24677:625-1596(-)
MYFWALAHEEQGTATTLRTTLLAAYRTAALRHNYTGQAVVLNLLLRNYVQSHLYDLADKLVSQVQMPQARSNNQLTRYLYYVGRIRAVQLDYTESFRCLQEALRKAPQNSALGFRCTVQKFEVVVQLLMGQIPERSVFRQSGMQKALEPYLRVTQALRVGDLAQFNTVMDESLATFQKDDTLSLVRRLRHNVIKTGLRKINLSYSRISIADIAKKLSLDSAEDTECIVAKAIRDGVIDAVIDHDGGFIRSKENLDIYSTIEPSDAFHRRISFCLGTHNEAVRAMRFPDRRDDAESAEERRERMKEEQELAHTLAEEDDEEPDF